MATGPRYRVEIMRPALKQLAALPREEQERVTADINALADDPRPRGVEKLKGEDDQYRIRVGPYRIIYTIRDDRLIVLVLRIGHRRDVYRKKGAAPIPSILTRPGRALGRRELVSPGYLNLKK